MFDLIIKIRPPSSSLLLQTNALPTANFSNHQQSSPSTSTFRTEAHNGLPDNQTLTIHHNQSTQSEMPVQNILLKGAKLAVKGTGFVSLVAVVNFVPCAAYQHFGPWSPKELERGMKAHQGRP